MGSTLLFDLGTEIAISVCAAIGMVFYLMQWFLLLIVNVSPEHAGIQSENGKMRRLHSDGEKVALSSEKKK
ncbi:pyrophosphate-energized vacuolar membrane proton pump-like [Olea europaea subsp. europaea]|uniref:Pyrophosphate-energized vacuolar membrane proton pump-like n=1 Tax=Olea europaea subsp. europaea TaxID=158383 RepID=A0A8S0UK12_OLEEU|nr:pyrophosphate-energized vacuolar membrane proton pump-like [Olea europaea subsp. europaea]